MKNSLEELNTLQHEKLEELRVWTELKAQKPELSPSEVRSFGTHPKRQPKFFQSGWARRTHYDYITLHSGKVIDIEPIRIPIHTLKKLHQERKE